MAGIKAAQAGFKTAVIEKEKLGGVCLNWGCIPTKALLRTAELYEAFNEAEAYGLKVGKIGFDPGKMVERSRKVADKMNRGVGSLLKKYKVTHLPGTARFSAPQKLDITDSAGKHQVVEAKNIIIATGARPKAISAFPVDNQTVLNYRGALVLKKFPKRLLIVGAGAIGVEFAYYFSTFGVEVHLVEMMPQLLPSEDSEIAGLLDKAFRKKGIHCYTGTSVESFQAKKGKVTATLKQGKNATSLECDMGLIAVGMEGVLEGLELEKAGVKTEKGFVLVDAEYRTNIRHIFAIGDVAGRQLLAHKASAEAEAAVAVIAGHPGQPVDYGQIPACTYCQPQVASIGLTEQQCQQQGLKFRVGRFPYAASGKANAIGHLEGMVKLIFGEPYGQLLGAHLIGPEVTELVAELGLAMRLEATYEEILATVHAHPTLSEAVFEATGVAYGLSANL